MNHAGQLLVSILLSLILGTQTANGQHIGTEPADPLVLAEWYSPRNPFAAFELNGAVAVNPENDEMYFWNFCPATNTWRLIPSIYGPDPCYDGGNSHMADLEFGAGAGLDSGAGGLAIAGLGKKKRNGLIRSWKDHRPLRPTTFWRQLECVSRT